MASFRRMVPSVFLSSSSKTQVCSAAETPDPCLHRAPCFIRPPASLSCAEVQSTAQDVATHVVGPDLHRVCLSGPLSSCSCGEYRHSGIPCLHLAAACFAASRPLIDVVHPSEHFANYQAAYEQTFDLPTEQDIERHQRLRDSKLRLPPSRPNPAGRPRTRRAERARGSGRGHRSGTRTGHGGTGTAVAARATAAAAAPAASSSCQQPGQGQSQRRADTCSECGQVGHNRRRCPRRNSNGNGNGN